MKGNIERECTEICFRIISFLFIQTNFHIAYHFLLGFIEVNQFVDVLTVYISRSTQSPSGIRQRKLAGGRKIEGEIELCWNSVLIISDILMGYQLE